MNANRRHLPTRARLVGLVLVLAAAVAYLVFPRGQARHDRIEGSGTIEATQVDVAPQVAGRVIALRVREGAAVRAGDVVAEIDAETLDAQVTQAEAVVAAADARLRQAESALAMQEAQSATAIAQARAVVDASRTRVPQAGQAVELQEASVAAQERQAEAQVQAARAAAQAAHATARAADAALAAADARLENARADAVRLEHLYREGAVAAQHLDAARAALAAATAQRDAARAQRDAAAAQRQAAISAQAQADAALDAARANRRMVPIREFDVETSRAQVAQAQAALRSAEAAAGLIAQRARDVEAARAAVAQARAALRLARTARAYATVRTPIAGVVVSRSVEVGDLVTVGTPMVTVADLSRVSLRVFVGEGDLGRVRLGQPVEVRVDAFPGRTFPGTVEEISSRAEFTPGNVQTREERTKLVFAVRIGLDNPDGVMKPGLPADAAILAAEPAP